MEFPLMYQIRAAFYLLQIFSCSFALTSFPHPLSHMLKVLAAVEIRERSAFFIMEEGKVGNSDMRILVTFSFPFFI